MEKLVAAIHGLNDLAPASIAGALAAAGAKQIRVNIRDSYVDAGQQLVQKRGDHLPDCMLQFWLPNANPIFRAEIDATLSATGKSFHSWLVSEAGILDRPEQLSVRKGERSPGFSQIAMLTLPPDLDWSEWRRIWRDSHTQIAIETQSNFEYVQNLVVECLTPSGGDIVAIVEEAFPIEALTDPFVFFDAGGDKDRFRKNLDDMMESCARFIAPGSIDVFPTSQYDFG